MKIVGLIVGGAILFCASVASAATVVLEYDGSICKCDATVDEAVSTDTTTLTQFGSPFGAYYLGYSAVLKTWSDGTESLTINNHTLTYTPQVGAIWSEHKVDNLGDNFIVWRDNLPNMLGILEVAVICYVTDPITPGVPEPSTWAMMLMGFAFLGWIGRRMQRKRRGEISVRLGGARQSC